MRKISAVIGANFGDEGKGLTTDFLANPDSLVVRFNGGAQAGHTVNTTDGKRHVFQHFGSGTFQDAPTLLSKFFVLNPISFRKEHEALLAMGVMPKVFADARCPVTTFLDMMMNQGAEKARGSGRHGSCGLGFGETLEREQNRIFSLTVADLLDEKYTSEKLGEIARFYIPYRAKHAEVSSTADVFKFLYDLRIRKSWLEDVEYMLDNITLCGWETAVEAFKGDIIFEGAQGLMLDQNHKHFPHVTRSSTGLKNVITLMENAGLKEPIEAHYVTRTYLTRHGNGPLAQELYHSLPYKHVEDKTNVENEYQGKLRYAYLDLHELSTNIWQDTRQPYQYGITRNLVVTHADQLDAHVVRYYEDGKEKSASLDSFLNSLGKNVEAKNTFVSFGNTRNNVQR